MPTPKCSPSGSTGSCCTSATDRPGGSNPRLRQPGTLGKKTGISSSCRGRGTQQLRELEMQWLENVWRLEFLSVLNLGGDLTMVDHTPLLLLFVALLVTPGREAAKHQQ